MLALTRCLQVVLTDLNDDWRLMWIDGFSVGMGKCSCRAQAVALIKSLVQQVGATWHWCSHSSFTFGSGWC